MTDVKSFLLRVEKIDAVIENKLKERKQWEDMAYNITSSVGGERVQSSGGKNKVAEAIEKCIDMEEEIDRLVDKLIEAKKQVISAIEKLPNPTEYRVLHMRYIEGFSLLGIAERCGREYTWVTTVHGRALKNLRDILDKNA